MVLNGIHSRTGSFTYAKPIEMGVSTYMLSEEELKAVEVAKNNTYQPEHEKVVKVRFKPTFRKKDKDRAMDEQITLDQVEMVEVDETKEKQAKSSIGDVTEAEKELILKEETLAGKIAAAESILKKREEARAAAEKAHLPEEENLGDAMESAVERAIAEAKISEPIFQEPVFVEKQEETDIM